MICFLAKGLTLVPRLEGPCGTVLSHTLTACLSDEINNMMYSVACNYESGDGGRHKAN